MGRRLPAANIITDQYPYPFSALEDFILESSAYIVVPDRAALAAKNGTDGQHAFSLKARDEWIADPNDPGPAVPSEKIAMPGGGFWVRTQYADASYRSRVDAPGVPAWTVDALVGDDEAAGTPAAPIKTHAEFARRIGNFGQWKLQGNVTLTYVSIAAMPPATDPLPLDDAPFCDTPFGGTPFFLTIHGPPLEPKAGHGGLVTAKTDRVRATNTENTVTTTGILDATDIGLRLQITAGPRAGAMTYVDSILGANQAAVSEWEITDITPTVFVDTHVFPSAVGADPTQVFLAGKIFVDSARIRGGSQGSLLFVDLDIGPINDGDPVQYFADGAGLMWNRCRHLGGEVAHYSRLREGLTGAFWGLMYELNCYSQRNNVWRLGSEQENAINGGLYHALVFAGASAGLQWDADAKCARLVAFGAINAVGSSEGGFLIVGAGSCFRSQVSAFNCGGESELALNVLFYGVAAMYGQANTIAGVQTEGHVAYQSGHAPGFTVTGAPATDFQLNGDGVGFYFDNPTATFLPAGGIPTTWANFVAAQPAGFGGQAHGPRSSVEIVPQTAQLFP